MMSLPIVLSYLIIILSLLISVALLTVIERKGMASLQRRYGPSIAGIYGILQPISDGVKLFIKQLVRPNTSYHIAYYIAPIVSFSISLIMFIFIPVSEPLVYTTNTYLVILLLSSFSVYGVLLSGWSSNSIYTIIGSIRSTSQLISYELMFTLYAVLIFMSNEYNFQLVTDTQDCYYNFILTFPIAIIYFIIILAETNRTPFDLPEAESELVSGFNTEHSAFPFAYFFLAEYTFIIVQSIIYTYLFLGDSSLPFIDIPESFDLFITIIKCHIVIYCFIVIRATLPRLRYDLLSYTAWNTFIPISITFLILDYINIFL